MPQVVSCREENSSSLHDTSLTAIVIILIKVLVFIKEQHFMKSKIVGLNLSQEHELVALGLPVVNPIVSV